MSIANQDNVNKTNFFSRFKTKEFWLKVLEYSSPALISFFVFLLAMIVKGIAPFGVKSLSYIDYNEGLVPSYTSLWDWLHGNVSFFASFNLGAGAPLYASNVLNCFFSPISWLIAIFPRENVIFGIAFLLIVKFALMSTTAYICFKKFFSKVDKKILVLFSLVWTFSGWTVIHFTNIGWLDIMALLPLFILSFKELVSKGKMLWFVIILSYMLILSYYISYMILVGVVVISTVYYFTIAPKENRKRTASLLFYGIMISIAISCVAFIPSCVTSLGAHRFSSEVVGNNKYWLVKMFTSKVSILLMQALPVLFFIKLMTTIKKDKKNVLFFLISFCVCCLGLVIEPINMMWHTGSYYSYPFRYSFILILLMIFGSLYYIQKYYFEKPKDVAQENFFNDNSIKKTVDDNLSQKEIGKKIKKESFYSSIIGYVFLVLSISTFLLTSMMFLGFGVGLSSYRNLDIASFLIYLFNFMSQLYIILYTLNYKKGKGKFSNYTFVAIFCLIQICVQMISFTGLPFGSIANTARISNIYNISTSQFESGYKLKDRDNLYNANFGHFLNYPTLQSWIHISSEEQYQAYHYLGYQTSSTLLYSAGGTYLTDILVGNKYVLSYRELDSRYYTLVDKFDYYDEDKQENISINCYEMNFTMKPAWTTNVDLSKVNDTTSDMVANQNYLYKALYNKTEDIMKYTTFTYEILEDKVVLTIDCVADQNLYLVSNKDDLKIDFQDKTVNVMVGLSDFGVMSESKCTAEIYFKENETYFSKEEIKEIVQKEMKFATFDVATFKTVHEESVNSDKIELKINQNEIEIYVNNTSNSKYLFVPYINVKDMHATNYDKEILFENSIFNFMQIAINEGNNLIKMHNKPQLIAPCLLVTLIALVIFIVMSILNHRFKISENKVIIWIGVGGAVAILGVVGFLVYLKPFFKFFVVLFS